VGAVIKPAGIDASQGIISSAYLKDPTDPGFKDDPGMQEWREFMAKYLPGADINDITYVFAYSASKTLMQVLKQCDGDFSRENVMRQATNLHDLELRTLLPGIKINTSPTNYRPMRALQLMKWDGKSWVEAQRLLASDGAPFDYFGESVAIDGNFAVVGAQGHDSVGGGVGLRLAQAARLDIQIGKFFAEHRGSGVRLDGFFVVVDGFVDVVAAVAVHAGLLGVHVSQSVVVIRGRFVDFGSGAAGLRL
jgi:hypothetical protein